jgi:hypothetical protein
VAKEIFISSLRLRPELQKLGNIWLSCEIEEEKSINCFRFVENLASDIFQECNGISVMKVLNLQKLVRMRKRRRLRKNEKV